MFPFTGLRLLAPALIPSWRFFDAVSASPRLDYAVLASADPSAENWREFRPRPAVVGARRMLGRLLWNPRWNESLYLVSLAERLMSARTAAAETRNERELLRRVARDLDRGGQAGARNYLQIRLRFLRRTGPDDEIAGEIVYVSSPYPIAELLTR